MTIDEIINDLIHYQRFPKAAIEAAIEQQALITPRLLEHLQWLVDAGEDIDEDDERHMLTLFVVYLLAQFREEKAYPLIVKLVSGTEDDVFFHLGDVVTEGLGRILASVCHGDTGLIKQLIGSNNINGYVRSSALHSLITLYTEQAISRDEVLSYFKSMYRLHPVREQNHIWNSLALCSEAMRFTELLPDIRQSYEEGLADPRFSALSSIEKNIVKESDDLKILSYDKHFITDVVAELKDWACFQPKTASAQPLPFDKNDNFFVTDTISRNGPKIGRNDPCPCGSGKKYKKCCG